WAVHVALWERGELTAGAVALPAQGRVLSTAEPPPPPGPAGTGQAGEPAFAQPLRIVVSRSRAPSVAGRVAQDIGATLMPLGSAGAKAAAVISGEADAYLHDGGQYEWDSAAPGAGGRAPGPRAGSTSGTRPPRWRWRWPPGCTPPASTAQSSSTTRQTSGSRIS